MSTGIPRAKTIGDLKRHHGRLDAGYQFFPRQTPGENSVELYIVPNGAAASAPSTIPEGGRLIGIAEYESRDAMLVDRS